MSFGLYDDGYMGSSARDHFEERERDRKLEKLRGDCRTEAEKVEYKKRYCISCWRFCKHDKPGRSHCDLGRGRLHKKRPPPPSKNTDLQKYFDNYRHRILQSGRVKACEFWESCIKMDEICKRSNPKYRPHKGRMFAWCDTKKAPQKTEK